MLAMVGVIRRETCYATGPWCEDLRIGVDEEFSLRSLLATKKVVYLPGSLCAVRQHSGPRLMDGQNKAHGLELELLAYRRMAECAALRGCLSDPRILLPLSQHITGVIVRSLQTGNARVAAEAIRTCGELPVEMGRRIRLKLYQMLSLMPPGMFLRFRWVWLKTRQMVFEMPKRAIDRSRAGRIARDREQVTT
jgi:hypothetical protein